MDTQPHDTHTHTRARTHIPSALAAGGRDDLPWDHEDLYQLPGGALVQVRVVTATAAQWDRLGLAALGGWRVRFKAGGLVEAVRVELGPAPP
jgi:hypothetical protein